MARHHDEHRHALHSAWRAYGDERHIVGVTEVSAHVSTNHVYRVALDDGHHVIAKLTSYGSYFLFAEDHDRLHTCARLLRGTRFEGMLADVLTRDGRPFTWYDGAMWAAFYDEVPRLGSLPRILSDDEVVNFASEIAAFHLACTEVAAKIPLTSKSLKSDAIHLLDLLTSHHASETFQLDTDDLLVLARHTHRFLEYLEAARYDYWKKIPVLIDWNLGNFSVEYEEDGTFRLYSRWDYDWFRIEPRLLDFYFLSRVSSRTGDRTMFTYSPHTLIEPRFLTFVRAYHEAFPLSETDVRFIPEVYRFFILNYVVLEGARFFRADLCARFRREAAQIYLPELDLLDIGPLLAVLG